VILILHRLDSTKFHLELDTRIISFTKPLHHGIFPVRTPAPSFEFELHGRD